MRIFFCQTDKKDWNSYACAVELRQFLLIILCNSNEIHCKIAAIVSGDNFGGFLHFFGDYYMLPFKIS